jgi:hypothetical protein
MIADFHHPMTNLLDQAINCNDGDRAAKIIQNALGIESDDVANSCLAKDWPANREQRANSSVNGCKRRSASFADDTAVEWPHAAFRYLCQIFSLFHP